MQADGVDQLAHLDLFQNLDGQLKLREDDEDALEDLLLKKRWCLLHFIAMVD